MIGTSLLHYDITAKLGDGGMGVVYLATDTKLDREIALKVLSPALMRDPDARVRLLREARAASRLNHPNIITIYAAEEAGDTVFIVTEYVRGQTLRDLQGTRPLAARMDIALQVCDALQEAHDHGLIHRDIKPENVMVDERGRAKVMDFGVAQDVTRGGSLGETATIAGTAFYMSPEQAQGSDLDVRSDVFSLGVLMYEMFTGARPFDGQYYPAVIYDILNSTPPPMTDFDPGIPSGLEDVVLRCLRKSREDRFAGAGAVAAELRTLQAALDAVPSTADASAQSALADPRGGIARVRHQLVESILAQMKTPVEGNGTAIILSGESGIGKSRVAEEVLQRLGEKTTTQLRTRCLPQSGGLPYHAFATALRDILPVWDQSLLDQLLKHSRNVGADYSNRLPILRAFLDPASTTRASLNREQVWDAVLVFFQIISADRPVVLFVDDLQWADDDSVGLFAYLTRNVGRMRLMLLATLRSEDLSAQAMSETASDTLRQLRIENTVSVYELARLSAGDTRAVIQSHLGTETVDDQLVRMIEERSDGNPLFIKELLAYLIGQGELEQVDATWRLRSADVTLPLPRRIQDLISQRIERLTPDDRTILEYAACETESFDSHALCACVEMDRIALLRKLQQFETQLHLIRHDRTRYRFDHPMIRDVLYDRILPELRVEYHRQIATVLMERAADNPNDWPRIAHHLLESEQPREALPYLLGAADRARAVHANHEALRLYRQAERIHNEVTAPDPLITLRMVAGIGDVLLALGQIREALDYDERGVTLAENHGEPTWLIDLLEKTSVALRITGQLDRAVTTAQRAGALASDVNDPPREASCRNTLAFIHSAQGQYERTIELSQKALDGIAECDEEQLESIALGHKGLAHFHLGEFREAVEVLSRATVKQRSIGDTRGLAQSLNFAGLAYHRLGEFSRAIESHEESLKIKRSLNDLAVIPGGLNALGDVYRDMGLIDDAIAKHAESLELAKAQGNMGSQCDNLRDLGAEYLIKGELDKAEDYLQQVHDLATRNGYTWYIVLSQISMAELALARDDGESADRLSESALQAAIERSARELTIKALWARAQSLKQRGLGVDAIAAMQEALGLAREVHFGSLIWQLTSYLATLYRDENRIDDYQIALADARDQLKVILQNITDPQLRHRVESRPEIESLLQRPESQ